MKKLAFLSILSLAVATQAANIKWAVGSTLYGVDKNGNSTISATSGGVDSSIAAGSFVLVYLGQNANAISAADLDFSAEGGMSVVDTIDASDFITTSGKTANIGKANISQTTSVANNANATYQVFWLYDGEYRDIYSDAGLSSAVANVVKVTYDGQAYATNPNPLYAAGSSSAVSYVSTITTPIQPEVPEPATGALALAGVALLFKRRRA